MGSSRLSRTHRSFKQPCAPQLLLHTSSPYGCMHANRCIIIGGNELFNLPSPVVHAGNHRCAAFDIETHPRRRYHYTCFSFVDHAWEFDIVEPLSALLAEIEFFRVLTHGPCRPPVPSRLPLVGLSVAWACGVGM